MVRNNFLAVNDFFPALIVFFSFLLELNFFIAFYNTAKIMRLYWLINIQFDNKHPPLDCYIIVSIQKSVKPILV